MTSILHEYVLDFLKSKLTIQEYSYKIAKNNKQIENINIINDYIDYGDCIETEFLRETQPKKMRQIAHILLERYLRSKL